MYVWEPQWYRYAKVQYVSVSYSFKNYFLIQISIAGDCLL